MFQLSNFAEQLAELMAEEQYTEAMLAKAMGIGNSKLSLYLNAKRAASYESFLELIEFFHCSADYLLGISEYPNRDKSYKKAQPFGIRLRTLLKEENITQYAFIKATKISWSIFHNWLTEKSLPAPDNLVKVAEFMHITVDYLLGREL